MKQLHTPWHDIFLDSIREFPIFGWNICPHDNKNKNGIKIWEIAQILYTKSNFKENFDKNPAYVWWLNHMDSVIEKNGMHASVL